MITIAEKPKKKKKNVNVTRTQELDRLSPDVSLSLIMARIKEGLYHFVLQLDLACLLSL